MIKRIWVMNHYAGTQLGRKAGRHYWFAKHLSKSGYEPTVFCSNTMHAQRAVYFDNGRLWNEQTAEEIRTPFIFVRARLYSGNGRQRVGNMVDYYRNVQRAAKEYAELNGKPDIILASSVHPLTMLAGERLAKYFGVKCICEVRDLWPESLFAYGTKFSKNSLFAKVLYAGEKYIYKKADALIFTMEGGKDYITEKGWDKEIDLSKVYHINNGIDLEEYNYNKKHFIPDIPELEDADTFRLIYCGTVRNANNVGALLDAMKKVQNSRVKLLIFGGGDKEAELKERVGQENIKNVVFEGRVEKKYIPYILSKADACILHWKPSPIVKYGMSMNKQFEYLAAGKPIISTVRTGYDITERYNCGFYADSDMPALIDTLAAMDAFEYAAIGERARKAAEDYDFSENTKKLIKLIGAMDD